MDGKTVMDTRSLIQGLSQDARMTTPRLGPVFAIALALAALAAASAFLLLLHPRADFWSAIQTPRFAFKLMLTISLTCAAAVALFAAERPGARPRTFVLAIVPALMLLAVGAEMIAVPEADWAARWIGRNSSYCMTYIPLIGVVPLVILLVAMRRGAPSRPALAGALSGLLAGGIAAAFYATHCPDDSPLFVATWYMIGIGILTVAGAATGSRMLRW
jgi:hypothetical protein